MGHKADFFTSAMSSKMIYSGQMIINNNINIKQKERRKKKGGEEEKAKVVFIYCS